MRQKHKQSGFAILLVMVLLGMGVVLGLSYLSVASVKSSSAENYCTASKARYMAESGLQHALYVLQTNPSQFTGTSQTRPLGPYYIDGSSDNHTFWASLDAPGHYVVTAKGTTGSMSQTSQAKVFASGAPQFGISRGLMVSTPATWLPLSLQVNGDFYVNGNLTNFASINGNVSCTGLISDPYRLIAGSPTSWANSQSLPSISWSDYKNYNLFGSAHASPTKTTSTFAANDSLTNGGAITPNNPGGVIWLKNSGSKKQITLPDNFKFSGTLISDCDIILSGTNIQLNAVDGFPAIVTSGRIIVNNKAQATINGIAVADGGMVGDSSNGNNSSTTINGGLISKSSSGYDYYLRGTHVLNQQADRLQLYDVSGQNNGKTKVTVQTWVK